MPDLPDPSSPRKPTKGKVGRPSSGVPRAEQIRRASAARRAGFRQLQILIPPSMNEALEVAATNHPSGKADYVLQLLSAHLQTKELYTPPEEKVS